MAKAAAATVVTEDVVDVSAVDVDVTPVEPTHATEVLGGTGAAPVDADDAITDDDFSALVDFDPDEVEDVIEEVPVPKEPVTPLPEPVKKPVVEPKVPEVQAPAQPAEPVAPVVAVAEAVPAPAATEDLTVQYQKFFDSSVEMLEKQVYTLDEETADMLDTTPSKVLPRMAARMHMQVLTAAVTQVANMLPQFIQTQTQRSTVTAKLETDFFTQFPQLVGQEETVTRMAAAYRNSNPKATVEQAIQEIGALSLVTLRMALPASPPAQAPAAVPVTPTSAKGGAAAPIAPAQPSMWEELIKEE